MHNNRREWLQLAGLSLLSQLQQRLFAAQTAAKELPLRAGNLHMLFDQETGLVRYIKYGQQEVVRGVYAAVRDRNWGTVRPQLTMLKTEIGRDTFSLLFQVTCRQGDVDFLWKGSVEGTADNAVTYSFEGEAKAAFLRNRIGFCVLHPIAGVAGRPVRIFHDAGKVEESLFPARIAPHQPFFAISAMQHQVEPGVDCKVTFSGDLFETEDQRNWSDASFKTYCTPLAKPYPVQVQVGDKVRQQVRVQLTGKVVPKTTAAAKEVTVTVGEPIGPLPGIGFGWNGVAHSKQELAQLRRLQPHHLRLELDLDAADWQQRLAQGQAEAERVGCILQVALHLRADSQELPAMAKLLRTERAPQVLLYEKKRASTSDALLASARAALGKVTLGAGTDANFTELNRNHVDAANADLVMYSINPQVHAFDDRSLVETLPMHAATLASAKAFCGNVPLLAGPITLKQRFNPVATDGKGGGDVPADPRQSTPFGAVWTLGSLKYLAEGGAKWGTYFETTGPKGVMENGRLFPTFAVFQWLAERGAATALMAPSSDALRADALVVRAADGMHAMVANYGPEPVAVRLVHARSSTRISLRAYERRALRLG